MKKAQIKLFETIAVLVVFFFLLVFGLVFYASTRVRTHVDSLDESFQLQVMNIVQQVNSLPELQCTSENIPTSNCIDKIKLEAFSQVALNKKTYYHTLFTYSDITVQQVYPAADPPQTWAIYSNPRLEFTQKSKNHIPILLFDPIKRKYNAAVLIVEVYT